MSERRHLVSMRGAEEREMLIPHVRAKCPHRFGRSAWAKKAYNRRARKVLRRMAVEGKD